MFMFLLQIHDSRWSSAAISHFIQEEKIFVVDTDYYHTSPFVTIKNYRAELEEYLNPPFNIDYLII